MKLDNWDKPAKCLMSRLDPSALIVAAEECQPDGGLEGYQGQGDEKIQEKGRERDYAEREGAQEKQRDRYEVAALQSVQHRGADGIPLTIERRGEEQDHG